MTSPTVATTQTPEQIFQAVQAATGACNRTELNASDGMDEGESRDPA